jgi:hypothetical protein
MIMMAMTLTCYGESPVCCFQLVRHTHMLAVVGAVGRSRHEDRRRSDVAREGTDLPPTMLSLRVCVCGLRHPDISDGPVLLPSGDGKVMIDLSFSLVLRDRS